MAISIAPADLTAGNLASRKTELARRRTGLNATAANRRHVLSLLQGAKRKGYNPQLIAKLQQRLQTATSQVGAAQKQYQGYYGGTYKPFERGYQQLTGLEQKNPELDGVLNQLLPFDPQAASDRLTAQSGLNQRLLEIKQGRDQLEQQYATGAREMETEQPNRFRQILGNFAGRGMAYSTGYGTAYGNEAADFAERRGQLDTMRQAGLAQAGLAEAGAQGDYLSQLAGILSGTTGRLAQNAGQLGMAGNSNLPLLLEIARRRLASQGGA